MATLVTAHKPDGRIVDLRDHIARIGWHKSYKDFIKIPLTSFIKAQAEGLRGRGLPTMQEAASEKLEVMLFG